MIALETVDFHRKLRKEKMLDKQNKFSFTTSPDNHRFQDPAIIN